MSVTVSMRLDSELAEALHTRAEEEKTTVSALIRRLLAQALAPRSIGERVGHLRGTVELPSDAGDAWMREIRERNWRR